MTDIGIVVIMGAFLIWSTSKIQTAYSKVELREAVVESQIEKNELKAELEQIRKAKEELELQVARHKQEVENFEAMFKEWG